MRILEQLLETLPRAEVPVRSVWCCAFWTLVESAHAGLASSMRSSEDPYHTDQPAVVPRAGDLEGRPVGEIARYVLAEDPVTASIGMAAVNSVLEVPAEADERNAAEVLSERGRGRNVAVVGHFPFARRLAAEARRLWVFERHPRAGEFAAEAFAEIAPDCDVVCLSGTTLMNHTLEELLGFCRHDAFVALVGPSTPFSPVLFDYGVDLLAGAHVTDTEEVLRRIRQGAIFRQVKGHGVRLLCWLRG